MGADDNQDNGTPADVESRDDEPLSLLADLPCPLSTRFTRRVRAGIERRLLVSQFVAGAWFVPVSVLVEFLSLGLGLFASKGDTHPRSGNH